MGIGVHQLAILQGSEVAHVERALVRAPAAFLGFEAHKEGHHFRSCARLLPGFLFHGYVRAISPSSPRQTGLDHLAETDLCSHKVIPWCLGQPPDYPAAPNLGLRPGHLADSNLDRVRTIVGSPRGTMLKPSPIYSATPNLTRTRTLLQRLTWVPLPRHRPEAIARRPKTKNRLECNFFAISDCYGVLRSRIAVQKRR